MTSRRMLFSLILIAALVAACDTTLPGPQPTASPVTPGVSPISSPMSAPTDVVPFRLDRPVTAGATEVRGTGPAGVPIFIADITFMGEPLGTGTIGSDGKFSVQVKPLAGGHRIGVALGILDGTRWKPEDFYRQDFYGPDAMQAPQVGFFHDTVLVGE